MTCQQLATASFTKVAIGSFASIEKSAFEWNIV